MLTIKVLGPGCQHCNKVEEITKTAVSTMGIETQIEKITDTNEIIAYGVLSTPGLVINGKQCARGGFRHRQRSPPG